MRKLLLRAFGALLLVQLGLGLYAWRSWSPAPPVVELPEPGHAAALPMPLRSGAEHDRVRAQHGEPYVLELEAGEGALLYFGGWHGDRLDDPQLADIEARWEAFRPTVALCEGRSRGYFVGWLVPRFAGLPEPAKVHALARRDGVRLLSLEPDYEDEVAALLEVVSDPAHVALYLTMRVYFSESGGQADESLALELAAKRTQVKGLEGTLDSIAAIDAAWSSAGCEGDWRTDARERSGSLLERLSDASRRVRGEHMARALIHLVRQGERVFAVVGSGHVIRQELALCRALDSPPPSRDSSEAAPEAGPEEETGAGPTMGGR